MKVRHEGGIVIQGVDNLLIRLSRCCNPVPGDGSLLLKDVAFQFIVRTVLTYNIKKN